MLTQDSGQSKSQRGDGAATSKTQEESWQEREKRLEELLEKDGGPNPKAKEDFNRLLKEMARSSE